MFFGHTRHLSSRGAPIWYALNITKLDEVFADSRKHGGDCDGNSARICFYCLLLHATPRLWRSAKDSLNAPSMVSRIVELAAKEITKKAAFVHPRHPAVILEIDMSTDRASVAAVNASNTNVLYIQKEMWNKVLATPAPSGE